MGPDVAMSASMPGYYVKIEDGKYFHSSDVVTADEPPAEAQLEELELGELQGPWSEEENHREDCPS